MLYNLALCSCISEICQVRLDFFKVVLQAAGSTTGSCATTYTTITPGSTGQTKFNIPPALCGTLTGQHCKIFKIELEQSKYNFFKSLVVYQRVIIKV